MTTEATLTSKGQTTIPKEIRDSLGMKPGDRMTFTLMPDATVVMRLKNKSITELAGTLQQELFRLLYGIEFFSADLLVFYAFASVEHFHFVLLPEREIRVAQRIPAGFGIVRGNDNPNFDSSSFPATIP